MKAAEIRSRFLEYFRARGHEVVASSPLVPADDPTLLFTNAGMVQFKGVFLGQERVPYRRAVTSQKCVRAGGKHNDLEEVGKTARHHTFFEMLGNFSFGDYFKRDAIAYAWELLTIEFGLDPERMYATVHHSDDEAAALWEEIAGLPPARIFRLGDKDNFWQMADTGPCGPCSELLYDQRPAEERSGALDTATFERLSERGDIIELWNLVFMQFDRDDTGHLEPLPAPSIDTGAGLERVAAVLQRADSNYHTDLFRPLLERVAAVVGRPYEPNTAEGVSFRVLADHARAVAFLLSDGVLPSNEGRGYVLRRILRRGVRHAWLLGRREPTLVEVVEQVIEEMKTAYPDLAAHAPQILRATRVEEERFLATIAGGLDRFEEIAPVGGAGVIPGDEVFKLYDTFGFPLDLTTVMAEERGYSVDVAGFERALEAQRTRSREARAQEGATGGESIAAEWGSAADLDQHWVGYETRSADVLVRDARDLGEGRFALILDPNPFYAEGGGQVSDVGSVEGDGWRLLVQDVQKVQGNIAVLGPVDGIFPDAEVGRLHACAAVDTRARHDTERNHTATHLLHAALRSVLGDHVRQRGSLVAPERLRFDFSHDAPMSGEQIRRVEARVQGWIWDDRPVRWQEVAFDEAKRRGAMALFGEKYGDVVRMVEVPPVSLELCGGTHVRHTGEIGLFKIVSESGVAAGVRRIEALTGRAALGQVHEEEERLEEAAALLKTRPAGLLARVQGLLDENAELEQLLKELRAGGGAGEQRLADEALSFGGGQARAVVMRTKARAADEVRDLGDRLRAQTSHVAVVGTEYTDGKVGLMVSVSDDLVQRGVRAGDLVRELAALGGGSGGGRPHLAQGGVDGPEGLERALAGAMAAVRARLQSAGGGG
ncbi:MAG: alanine--tRNA ligase [Gemmatimonadota bacterium]